MSRLRPYCEKCTTRFDACKTCTSDELSRLRAENSDLKEGLHRYANGYQGSCYACEPVGMMNVAVRAENERLRGERDTAWAELRGIREAIFADPEESTLDEVRAAIERKDRALEKARDGLTAIFTADHRCYWDCECPRSEAARAALAAIDAALGNVREGS